MASIAPLLALAYRGTMRIAFKEWAVVVDALGAGEQILILRKGGVSEGRRGFQVEYSEFLLFPTLFHQQRELVIPTAQERFDRLAAMPLDSTLIHLDFYAHAVAWERLDRLETAEKLRGQHILRDEVVAERFDWGKEPNIFVLAVRVFRLPATVTIPSLPAYAGCKSWVELEEEISTDGATPVLSKEDFNEKLDRFHSALNAGLPEPPAP